jgi:broad specificity phosphatase PhoE
MLRFAGLRLRRACRPRPIAIAYALKMSILYLVRHGRAAAATPNPGDPELCIEGHEQARAAARSLGKRIDSPIQILSSPLRRCRLTAEPLAQLWGTAIRIEPRVTEMPSPQSDGVARSEWLRLAFANEWPDIERAERARDVEFAQRLSDWRQGVLDAIFACTGDAVIFSHFVAINVIVGEALGLKRVVCLQADNASVTIVETLGRAVRVIELGREAASGIR